MARLPASVKAKMRMSGASDEQIRAAEEKSEMGLRESSQGIGQDSQQPMFEFPQQEQRSRKIAGSMAGGQNEADVLGQAGMASGNPYAMAGGAGLMVLSAKAKREQREAELRAEMKLDRINRQQNAIQRLMNLSQNMRL